MVLWNEIIERAWRPRGGSALSPQDPLGCLAYPYFQFCPKLRSLRYSTRFDNQFTISQRLHINAAIVSYLLCIQISYVLYNISFESRSPSYTLTKASFSKRTAVPLRRASISILHCKAFISLLVRPSSKSIQSALPPLHIKASSPQQSEGKKTC